MRPLSSCSLGRPLTARGRVDGACYVGDVTMILKADLLKLDVTTRLELIEELWDSIASDDVLRFAT